MPPPLTLDKFPFHMGLVRDLPEVDGFILGPGEVEPAHVGKIYKLRESDIRYYVLDVKVGFPQPESVGMGYEDFSDWIFTHDMVGFLIMSTRLHARKKVETYVAAAAQTDFPLEKRYIEEGYGFTVTKDGSPEAATVENNGSTPVARTAAMAGGENVVVTYLYWIPVDLLNDPLSDAEQISEAQDINSETGTVCRVIVQEQEPGAHLAV